jgi:hypothetical protein
MAVLDWDSQCSRERQIGWRDFQEQLFQLEKTNTDWYRIVAS